MCTVTFLSVWSMTCESRPANWIFYSVVNFQITKSTLGLEGWINLIWIRPHSLLWLEHFSFIFFFPIHGSAVTYDWLNPLTGHLTHSQILFLKYYSERIACRSGWNQTHYVAKNTPDLQSLPKKFWGCRCTWLCELTDRPLIGPSLLHFVLLNHCRTLVLLLQLPCSLLAFAIFTVVPVSPPSFLV